MRHKFVDAYRIVTANAMIVLMPGVLMMFLWAAPILGLAVFGVPTTLVIRRTIRGYRKGYRSARNRNGEFNSKRGWPMCAHGYCFYSGFEAGERQWRRDNSRAKTPVSS